MSSSRVVVVWKGEEAWVLAGRQRVADHQRLIRRRVQEGHSALVTH
jgi:hypothetical protein